MDSKTLIVAGVALAGVALLALNQRHNEPTPTPAPDPDPNQTPDPTASPPFSFGGNLLDEDTICRRFPSLCLPRRF
jgi:hypothetical protein